MPIIPKLLVSSVVRGAQPGESHGGLYLVDVEKRDVEQVVDLNTSTIDFEGRGGDRGLRGIAVIGKEIFVAGSDEIFVYDPWFRLQASYRNPYLKHCHEMSARDGKLYVTSTGFDAVVRFDLQSRQFDLAIRLNNDAGAISVQAFDPRQPGGPTPANKFHLNNVFVDGAGIHASGRNMPALVRLTESAVELVAGLPKGTNNAQLFRGGVIFNDTQSDAVVWRTGEARISSRAPHYDPAVLLRADADASGIARQAFARGLCPLLDTLVAAGSSPTTVSIHDMEVGAVVASVNLSMDLRNAAHGLAVWPF